MKRAARVLHPISAWQYIALQNADGKPRTLYGILGGRGGYRTDRPWFNKLIAAGYLEEVPTTPGKLYALFRRTESGAELAAQLGVMADRLGWKPG